MTGYLFLWRYGLTLLLGALIAGVPITMHYRHKMASEENDKLKELSTAVLQANATNHYLYNQLEEKELSHEKQLYEALAANDALAASNKRLQLKGTTCPTASSTTNTPSEGVGTPVELSEETRRAVYDLRASIIEDQSVIQQCKDYAVIVAEYLRLLNTEQPSKP